ncbi:CRISPR-associated Csx2 family protein [Methanomicrobium sp. W14]|uniref:TIGR02221 family CRISPR-associated protein n=1 Tax=Methanomicrobium sp. W14 TaxID=2817839 RepID=UPI001AE1FB1F|nr:TIGR02221 family CRISPR-associated protein [Methanomicrobium sp. W14]MBP2132408.1 CRISPR-associated Csx2 family protein [Methanomicrobium sp. W14]
MKLFSFIGSGNYEKTEYTLNGKSCNTDCIQEAICNFFPGIDEAVLFTTEEAYKCAYPQIKENLESSCSEKKFIANNVMIPNCMNEEELWEIFRIISGEVNDEDKIIFDITHGFRSIPFVSYLIASYLRSTGKVEIEKVLYGTYQKGVKSSPILDLTLFVSISDWIAGAYSFTESLDAGKISGLIQEINKNVHLEMANPNEGPKKLQKWSDNLNKFTIAVRLSRPADSLERANAVFRDYDQVKAELEFFVPFIDPIENRISGLQKYITEKPPDGNITWDYAEKQLELIGLMNEKNLFMQSMTLAREFMVTLLILWHGKYCKEWLDEGIRRNSERAMGALIREKRNGNFDSIPEFSEFLNMHHNEKESFCRLWGTITDLRNNIAHCGMKIQPSPIEKIPVRSLKIYSDLRAFFFSIRPVT